MNKALINIASVVAVGLTFQLAAHVQPFGLRLLATVAAAFVLGALYVPKYPKTAALEWGLALRPGQKVEVEGK